MSIPTHASLINAPRGGSKFGAVEQCLNGKSLQVTQRAYDVTVRFCDRYIEKRSRT